jgi:hypothetical protein
MRVLLDECVPRALRNDIPGHEVKTVAEVGWAGVKNGDLLRFAAAEFDLLITVDRNLEYQQSFEGLSLRAHSSGRRRVRAKRLTSNIARGPVVQSKGTNFGACVDASLFARSVVSS